MQAVYRNWQMQDLHSLFEGVNGGPEFGIQ